MLNNEVKHPREIIKKMLQEVDDVIEDGVESVKLTNYGKLLLVKGIVRTGKISLFRTALLIEIKLMLKELEDEE